MNAWDLGAGFLTGVGGVLQDSSNARQARENRKFQERMSSTAVQRHVEDLRRAGLNPALAYGQSASSPSGSTATIGNPLAGAVSSAREAKMAREQAAVLQNQAENLKMDIGLKQYEMPHKLNMMSLAEMKALAEIVRESAMLPLDVDARALQNRMLKLGLQKGQFVSDAFRDLNAVSEFVRGGVSRGGDALEAARSWLQSSNAREASQRARIRQKFFTPMHPRSKAERRSP